MWLSKETGNAALQYIQFHRMLMFMGLVIFAISTVSLLMSLLYLVTNPVSLLGTFHISSASSSYRLWLSLCSLVLVAKALVNAGACRSNSPRLGQVEAQKCELRFRPE